MRFSSKPAAMDSMMYPKTESHAVTLTAWLMLLGFWLFLSGFPCRNFKTAWYAAVSESYVIRSIPFSGTYRAKNNRQRICDPLPIGG